MDMTPRERYEESDRTERALLLTISEAAWAIRVSRSRMYELLARNEIPGVVRIGRSVRISRRSLEAWVDEQANGTANPA